MTQPPSAASLSLAFGGGPGFTVNSPPKGIRTAVLAGAAVFSGLVYWLRKSHTDGVRKRVIRRLDKIAPRTRYTPEKEKSGRVINGDCASNTLHLFLHMQTLFFLLPLYSHYMNPISCAAILVFVF